MNKKHKITLLIRILIGLIFLTIFYLSINLNEVVKLYRTINIYWFILALISILFIRVLMAIRWHYILSTHRMKISLKELIRIIFISTSVSQLLPGGIASDILRGYHLNRKYKRITDITATIVIDRFIGVYSLFFLAFIGGIIAKVLGESINLIYTFLILQIFFITGWIFIYIINNHVDIYKLLSNLKIGKFRNRIYSFISVITDLKKLKKISFKIFSLSLLVQVIRCFIFVFIYRAFGNSLEIIYFIIYIPIVLAVILLPISIGGIGVREGSLIYFFGSLGVAAELNVSAGLLSFLLQILAAIPGILLWTMGKRDRELEIVEPVDNSVVL